MELHQIQQQLIKKLEKEKAGLIIHTDIWCIPMHTYEITYQPVRKLIFGKRKVKFSLIYPSSSFELADK